ncbi:MnhB domain-containing protein [Natrarchaeobaculum sulfurireducens]|uniref:Multisubunit Na+/H+ antiporter, MnhB subunit n=1 Tax=Natrarchaeobaculum sulfurireducens TaxID=2044521 RepID=A0A346PNV9_9EURY|nr:MnhB domain-containing protein [Natrarchaeobaculum sulfurireducens]AXR78746.1 Multisubunit Na+/H+ antiporter, MnhB subunit [Natrarchaeobaculum sulfurireducens]AXR81204.1 PH adaptation potassium efflux system protein B2 [Natrarchaeobaculum sulfurireducens]
MTGTDHDDVESDGGQDADPSEADEIHGYAVDDGGDEDPGSTAEDAAAEAQSLDREEMAELQATTEVVESPVVKTASRTVTPFVVAFGIYLTLFGTSLPGGAFQGGVVMASTIVLVAMAFGFGPTQEWLDGRALAGLFILGAAIFGAVAFGALLYGGDVLELFVFPLSVENMVKLVEVAIAALVAGVIIGLVVWLAAGFGEGGESI